MTVLAGFAGALCLLVLLLVKQLFEKQAQLDAARAQLDQAHARLAEWGRFQQAVERSEAWGSPGRANEWIDQAQHLSDFEQLEQAPARLADLQRRVLHLRVGLPLPPPASGS